MFKTLMKQLSKVTHEIVISSALLFFYVSGSYLAYAPPLQLIALKATLVSLGFLHANITTKLAFPSIDWADDNVDKLEKYLRIALYIVFIHSYAQGG